MNDVKMGESHAYWTNLPAITHVERLEAACHHLILNPGERTAHEVLRAVIHLDVGAGLDPGSPAASFAKVAEAQTARIAEILEGSQPGDLSLRVATAHLCQTLTGLRDHLSGGPRTISFGPRRER